MSARGHLLVLLAGLALVLFGIWLWLEHGFLVAWNAIVAFCM
ncbi:hypothetical protein [Pedomonas sp. V897]